MSLIWSGLTGEVFTVVHDEMDVLVQIYGRVDTYERAVAVRDQCPADPSGLTLLLAAERALAKHGRS